MMMMMTESEKKVQCYVSSIDIL